MLILQNILVDSGQLQKSEWEEGWTSSWYCKEEESGEVYSQVAEQNGKKAGQQAGITEKRSCMGKNAGYWVFIAEQRAGRN